MLVTFGCSFVWGDELEGHNALPCSHWKHTFSEKLGKKLGLETKIVAQMGNSNDKIFRDVVSHIHNPNIEDPTHIVVVWSHPNRSEVALNQAFNPEDLKIGHRIDSKGNKRLWSVRFQQNMHQYGPSRPEWVNQRKVPIISTYYRELWNEHTSVLNLLTKMQSLESICVGKGIKLVQCQYAEFTRDTMTQCMDMNRFMHMKPWRNHVDTVLQSLRKESKIGLLPDSSGFDMNTRANKLGKTLRYGHPDESVHTWYANKLHKIFEDVDRWKIYFQPQKKGL